MAITALAKVEAAYRALAEARTVNELAHIRNQAEAIRYAAKQARMGIEMINDAAELKLRAERRAGELLEKMPKAKGTQGQLSGRNASGSRTIRPPGNDAETYADLDIDKHDAARWQQMAEMPQDDYEKYIADTRAEQREVTTAGVLRLAQSIRRQNHHEALVETPMPSGRYRVIYADPPWRYNDSGVITPDDNYGRAERHYPTMSIDELCDLGERIREMSEDDAVLFLWTTSPMLEDAFRIINAWGFKYKTSFVWDKIKHNFGHYNSVRHEFLMVCTRGSCTPDTDIKFDSVVSVERSNEHSEKPVEFRDIIEALYTHGQRIELFARRGPEGWETWGNEVQQTTL